MERAITRFANPRETHAERSDIPTLSKDLQEILTPAGEGLGMKELVSSMDQDALLNVARKVILYLRGRKQGVSREHKNLLPVTVAEELWKLLRSEQHIDAAALRMLEKEIVMGYTVPMGVCLAGNVSASPWILQTHVETPKKEREVDEQRLMSSEKQNHMHQSYGKLQAVKESLAKGIQGKQQPNPEEERARQLELDVKKLLKTSVPNLQRAQFDSLHRLVCFAQAAAESGDLHMLSDKGSQMEEIFRARLRREKCVSMAWPGRD